MFRAYYDASGNKNLGHVSVAGWLSTAAKWAAFQQQWNEALTYFGIPYFHASTFQSSQGHFAQWRGDEPRRRELIERLAKIVRETVIFGVSSTIYYRDFEAAIALRPEIGLRYKNAYVLAARSSMKAVDARARSVAHIFEHGDDGWKRIIRLCGEMDEGIPQFHPSTPDNKGTPYVVQLQSADLFAYESYRMAPHDHAQRFKPVYLDEARPPAQLLHEVPKEWHDYDYKEWAARALYLLEPPPTMTRTTR